MSKAVVIDLQEFRKRREAQRRPAVQTTPPVAMLPVVYWYPVQWVWLWPAPVAASVSA